MPGSCHSQYCDDHVLQSRRHNLEFVRSAKGEYGHVGEPRCAQCEHHRSLDGFVTLPSSLFQPQSAALDYILCGRVLCLDTERQGRWGPISLPLLGRLTISAGFSSRMFLWGARHLSYVLSR